MLIFLKLFYVILSADWSRMSTTCFNYKKSRLSSTWEDATHFNYKKSSLSSAWEDATHFNYKKSSLSSAWEDATHFNYKKSSLSSTWQHARVLHCKYMIHHSPMSFQLNFNNIFPSLC